MRRICRVTFDEGTDRTEIEDALSDSLRIVEDIHGRTSVRLGGGYYYLAEGRPQCILDASTTEGRHVAQVFIGLATRRFGESSFRVERVSVEERGDTQPELGRGMS